MAVAETQRFPELGYVFYHSGPDFAVRRLSQCLARAAGRGDLVIDDLDLTDQQFLELCKVDLFQKLLCGVQKHVTEDEIERVANAAVNTFLRAYRS